MCLAVAPLGTKKALDSAKNSRSRSRRKHLSGSKRKSATSQGSSKLKKKTSNDKISSNDSAKKGGTLAPESVAPQTMALEKQFAVTNAPGPPPEAAQAPAPAPAEPPPAPPPAPAQAPPPPPPPPPIPPLPDGGAALQNAETPAPPPARSPVQQEVRQNLDLKIFGDGRTIQETQGTIDDKGEKAAAVEAKKTANKKTRARMATGEKISSKDHAYTVLSLLGSGGFGDVYKVDQSGSKNEYALKTEEVSVPPRLARLKIEAKVLDMCTTAKAKKHFINLVDLGKTDKFKFIVMPIVGWSLDKIRREMLNGSPFTRSTATNITIQLLESLRDLHDMGFLHRDLKPANFAIGLTDDVKAIIYMLDFGVAKRFVDEYGKLLKPRARVAFMGTIRYAPRAGLRNLDQTRKDDLESLCYVILDIYDELAIPWRGIADRVILLKLKDNFMRNTGGDIVDVYKNSPDQVKQLVTAVNDLNPNNVNYENLINLFHKSGLWEKDKPLDWMNKELLDEKVKEKGGAVVDVKCVENKDSKGPTGKKAHMKTPIATPKKGGSQCKLKKKK